jgi:hypothetical protein
LPPPDEEGWANDICELLEADREPGEGEEDALLAELAEREGMI